MKILIILSIMITPAGGKCPGPRERIYCFFIDPLTGNKIPMKCICVAKA